MASQMVDARVLRTTRRDHRERPDGEPAVFTASGKAIEFAGFRRAYVEGSDDPAAELDEQETILPAVQGRRSRAIGAGAQLDGRAAARRSSRSGTRPRRRRASPKRRSSRSSKRLASAGPPPTRRRSRRSSGAATSSARARRSCPSFTAFAVTRAAARPLRRLRRHRLHRGDGRGPRRDLATASATGSSSSASSTAATRSTAGLRPRSSRAQSESTTRSSSSAPIPRAGEPVRVRIGRFGPFVQRGRGRPGHTASLPDDLAPADLTVEKAHGAAEAKAAGPRALGVDPRRASRST